MPNAKFLFLAAILVGTEASGQYDDIAMQSIRFSPDGKHVAFAAVSGPGVFAVLDGKRGPIYRTTGVLTFSPYSAKFAYVLEFLAANAGVLYRVSFDASR